MKPSDLLPQEFAGHFATYINQVSNEYTLTEELEISVHRLIKFVQNIPMDKFDYRYAEGKWTIKDIIQHLIDAERIFAYRALRFARNDKTALPGFDENDYVDAVQANNRSIQDLLTELAVVRQATLSLFKSFSTEELLRTGTASNNPMSVRALGFTIIGHQNHHQRVFEKRYLD
ncbi:DinB family protein [Flavobacterium sp.]|uniref:DinB family protein n=1 Tax=Flavobacterium sp. TaxID=239 RepID=UPI0025F4A40A|nr:DinB family protein [Flavobacterium sp.]